jgi:Spy/CpxP family protein refolding chaperone
MHHGKHHGEFHGERFHGKDFRDDRSEGPREHFKEGKPFDKKFDFKKGPGPEFMDSILQVTHEQKAAFESLRLKTDSTFKELRKQKHEAEKALGAALESKDEANIEAAKAKVLEADKALLEHRINGMAALGKILTAEQLEKFNAFHKEQMKKFREHKKGPKGPGPHGEHHHDGPHGNPPPPPPAN